MISQSQSEVTTRDKSSLNNLSVGVLGLGQIGGSICAALQGNKLNLDIKAFDPNEKLIVEALNRNIINNSFVNEISLIESSDVVLVATNYDIAANIMKKYRDSLIKSKLILDFCSNKTKICRLARRLELNNFVGGHPLAGTEKVAPEAWNSKLFDNACFLYAASSENSIISLDTFYMLIELIGSKAIAVIPEIHDYNYSLTIGVPHVLAYVLSNMKNEIECCSELPNELVGPSFNSATRVTESDPHMVDEILWHYREVLIPHLSRLEEIIYSLRNDLKNNNRSIIHKLINIKK